jgi:hypothetical protein
MTCVDNQLRFRNSTHFRIVGGKVKSIIRKLISQIKNWKWFAFALFMTLWLGFPFVGGIIINTYYPFLQRLGLSVHLISLLAFWGLALQKKFFYQFFWRLFIFIDILLFVLMLLFDPEYDLPLLWCIIILSTSVVISILWYMGLFIYAFRSKQIWGQAGLIPKTVPMVYSQYKWIRRKKWLRENAGLIMLPAIVLVIILCLTFIPMIIRNNRVIYPLGCPPGTRMLKYRRTTIPQLPEFERLFPNYLCHFDYTKSIATLDPNDEWDNIAYRDSNSPIRWCLSAGLHKHYLLVMEIDLVFAEVDPETEKIISPGSHDEPVFSLCKVSSISITSPFVLFGQRYAWADSETVKTLTADEWKKLVEADGDFSVLGIELKKDEPIPNFELAFLNNQ